MKFAWALCLLISGVLCQSETCREMVCSSQANISNFTNLTCFQTQVDELDNVTYVARACDVGKRCYMNGVEVNKDLASKETDGLQDTKLEAWCVYEEGFWTNLLPGSTCVFNYQCISGNCSLNRCTGKKENSTCVLNEECQVGLYCGDNEDDQGSQAIFYKTCQPYYENFAACVVNDTYKQECQPGFKCMSNQQDSQRNPETLRCQELYSKEIYDNVTDPDFCMFPYTVNGDCANVTEEEVLQMGSTANYSLDYPFKCEDQSLTCKLRHTLDGYYYSRGFWRYTYDYIDVGKCLCALDGTSDSYCPYRGYQATVDFYQAYKRLLFNSTSCHIDVWKKHNFFEWKYCVDNLEVLEEYKALYKEFHDWPMTLNNESYQCYDLVNPLNDYELEVYITLPTTLESGALKLLVAWIWLALLE